MPLKKAKPAEPIPTADPATAAIIERIVQEQGYRQWKGLPVPLWAELAAAAEIGSDALSEAKNGRRRLLVPEIAAIAAALGVRPGWLAFGEEPKYEPAVGSGDSTLGALASSGAGTAGVQPAASVVELPREELKPVPIAEPTPQAAVAGRRNPATREASQPSRSAPQASKPKRSR